MGELKVKDKDIVVPGEVLVTGMDYLPAGGAFRDNDEVVASQVGIVNLSGRLIKVVPLNWRYSPKRGDIVIGKVADISLSNWFVDFGYPNYGAIPLKDGSSDYIPRGADLTQYYSHGDYVVAQITKVSKSKQIDLTMKGPGLRKLSPGRIINVNPAKIPRIIGKQGSMVSMIKQMTDCKVIAGQNGFIWISGFEHNKEKVAVEAVIMVEKKAHIEGLTDQVKAFIEKELGGTKIDKKN